MSLSNPRTRARRAGVPLPGEPRYEVLPLPGVLDAVEDLPAGAAVTVTSSPRRGAGPTIDLAVDLAARGFRAVPHLAARQIADDGELASIITRLDVAGIRDVFVVGGDATEPEGHFTDGLDLLRVMNAIGHPFEHVGIPTYPEGHPLIDDDTLWAALKAKQHFATYAVSQMCFDADAVCGHIAQARRRGITLPVVAGIPGVVDTAKLLRVSLRIGIGDSVRFVRGNRTAVTRLLRPGGYRPDALVRHLSEHVRRGRCDLAGLHVYTFNHVGATVRRLDRSTTQESEVG